MAWCFLGKIGDRKGQKPNIFLKCGVVCGVVCAFRGCFHRVHLWQVVGSCGLSSAFVPCSLLLSALSPCACRVACKYALIWRFKGVFRGFWGADVYLYGLMSLRGLCGFCVREWLGGFGACCVFALVFFFFALAFHSFVLLLSSCFASCPFVLRCSGCLLLVLFSALSLCVFVISFSLSVYTQKRKGAPFWCVLSLWVVGVFYCLDKVQIKSNIYFLFPSFCFPVCL